ncbi:MAG: hypothetical protein HKK66_02985 [Chlorobiaceae bacterium]|nr:hypothetical protein [Chlorobiaceae bacterium]
MNKDKQLSTSPTFEDLPAMVAELSRKFDAFLERPEVAEAAQPMGVTPCAEFLTTLEGRRVTNGAVYNRVHKGMLPYRKIGARLFFIPEEILDSIRKEKKHHLTITAKQLS